MEQQNEYIEIDLLRLLRAVWRHMALVVLAAILCGGAAFAAARYLVPVKYQASTLLYVNNSAISVGSTSISLSDLSASQSLVETYIVILNTRLTLNEVVEKAGVDYSFTKKGLSKGEVSLQLFCGGKEGVRYMTDMHCHILPGMDDGSRSAAESLSMLEASAAQGVDRIVATPHFYAGENSPEVFLSRREHAYERLKAVWRPGMPESGCSESGLCGRTRSPFLTTQLIWSGSGSIPAYGSQSAGSWDWKESLSSAMWDGSAYKKPRFLD